MASNCHNLNTTPKIMLILIFFPGDYVALMDQIPIISGLCKTVIKIMAVIDKTKGKNELTKKHNRVNSFVY